MPLAALETVEELVTPEQRGVTVLFAVVLVGPGSGWGTAVGSAWRASWQGRPHASGVDGPMKVMPPSAHAAGRTGFSDRKPYPG